MQNAGKTNFVTWSKRHKPYAQWAGRPATLILTKLIEKQTKMKNNDIRKGNQKIPKRVCFDPYYLFFSHYSESDGSAQTDPITRLPCAGGLTGCGHFFHCNHVEHVFCALIENLAISLVSFFHDQTDTNVWLYNSKICEEKKFSSNVKLLLFVSNLQNEHCNQGNA